MPSGKTHVLVGLGIYLISTLFIWKQSWYNIGIGLIIALLYLKIPDIDLDLPIIKHRGQSHKLIGLIIFTIPMWAVSSYYGIIATGAIISHMLLDYMA